MISHTLLNNKGIKMKVLEMLVFMLLVSFYGCGNPLTDEDWGYPKQDGIYLSVRIGEITSTNCLPLPLEYCAIAVTINDKLIEVNDTTDQNGWFVLNNQVTLEDSMTLHFLDASHIVKATFKTFCVGDEPSIFVSDTTEWKSNMTEEVWHLLLNGDRVYGVFPNF